MNHRVTFDQITLRREVRVKCSRCRKSLRRVVSDSQTLNPFNKNKRGDIKTEDEIRGEIRKSLSVQAKGKFFCSECAHE